MPNILSIHKNAPDQDGVSLVIQIDDDASHIETENISGTQWGERKDISDFVIRKNGYSVELNEEERRQIDELLVKKLPETTGTQHS